MATITIRTDELDEKILTQLLEGNIRYRVNKSVIIKAAIKAFSEMKKDDRKKWIDKTLEKDGRLWYNRHR